MREIRRTGVTVVRGNVGFFTWHPRRQVVTVAHGLDVDTARAAVCLALAHRALGHWGDTVEQDVEARTLAAAWLIPASLAPRMLAAVAGYDEVLAEGCGVPIPLARVRLGLVGENLSNATLFGRMTSSCNAPSATSGYRPRVAAATT